MTKTRARRSGTRRVPRSQRLQQIEIGELRASALSLESLVSERQAAQRRADLLNVELEHQNSALQALNHELESFSYAVSHDLRGPLRSIHGFSEALERLLSGRLDGKEADYLRRICDAASRMDHLIEDLLRLSRITRTDLKAEPIDLTAMARSIAAELAEGELERVVEWTIAENLQTVADPILMRVVLANLLGNAWKYTGSRTLACIQFTSEILDGRTWFQVRDNGVGFDMAYAGKLFVPFQRLHSARLFSGSGIGLALVARAIARHNGAICAEGEVDRGCTFRFTIPETGPRGVSREK